MGIHSSHWPCVAVHANQNATKDHTDDKSSHLGFDNILPFGKFHDGWLLFTSLGIHIPIYPGDIILIRGASLSHQAWGDGEVKEGLLWSLLLTAIYSLWSM